MADSDESDEGTALVHTEFHSTKRSGAWKRVTIYGVGGVLLAILLVGCGFTGGIFAGMRLRSSSTSSPPSQYCPGKGFDWGSTVNVEGKNVSVAHWLDMNLQAKNMEDNLRYRRIYVRTYN